MSTRNVLLFYDAEWNQIAEAGHQFKALKSITYDVIHDVFYFSDRSDHQSSVYMLKLHDDGATRIVSLVNKTGEHAIEDLVYDFLEDALYWSDKRNKKIVKLSFDRSDNLKWSNETLLNVNGEPTGLAVDHCHRKLYYTIKDPKSSINVVSISTGLEELSPIIVGTSENHYQAMAVAIDYDSDRIYIADNRDYNMYSIDSITLNGTEFRTEISDINRTPRSVAIDEKYVYYLDGSEHALRRFNKNHEKQKTSEKVKTFQNDPTDIIVRKNFIISSDSARCQESKKLLNILVNTNSPAPEDSKMKCLHGGTYDATQQFCMCTEGHDGQYCEINLCYNFCLNGGDCWMERDTTSRKIHPKCSCKAGFAGDHCEKDICTNYCLNDGTCSVLGNSATCKCHENFSGTRCQKNTPAVMDTSERLVEEALPEVTNIPDVVIVHNEDDLQNHIKVTNDEKQHCPNSVNVTSIIWAVCITLSLLLFLVILVVIKKISRPARPKIRKKYVVHKNLESLTYRPTTEQCEVIIEDCCNMNICETVS